MDSLPTFDELYAVSDIHMGGLAGFQIFNRGPRLGAFISKLAREAPDRRVALVLNGDIIDSLAESFDGYISSDGPTMMERIANDAAFEPVWKALGDFVRQPGRTLIIVVGNHDIELALPGVEQWIRTKLAGDDAAARGRLTFATDGAGYACVVGGARVFCTHGNEVDGWNVVDHEALRRLAVSENSGLSLNGDGWCANAGTRLVKDVMNAVKLRYRWIDLLKPETKAALGVLLVLDPTALAKVTGILTLLPTKLHGDLVARGVLSASVQAANGGGVEATELLGGNLLGGIDASPGGGPTDTDALLLEIEEAFASDRSLDASDAVGTLGWGQLIWDRLRKADPADSLRLALQDWLADDMTFDVSERDGTFTSVMKRVGPGVDYVITGHTHLERAIAIGESSGPYYYNCGTWIRLLRLSNALLDDKARFGNIYDVLKLGTMEAIDGASVQTPAGVESFVVDRTSAVHISATGTGTVARLAHVIDAAGPDGVALDYVPGSEFWRKRQ